VVNQTSPVVTFTLTNGSSSQLNGLSASFTGADATHFDLTGGTCGSTLAANAICTYTATFSPSGSIAAATSMAATLSISSSNTASAVTYNVTALTGANSAQIPTLSEWGMIVFAALLMLTMIVAMKRKQETPEA